MRITKHGPTVFEDSISGSETGEASIVKYGISKGQSWRLLLPV